MKLAGQKNLRDLTAAERQAWERYLESIWGTQAFTALHEAGQPKDLPHLSYSSIRTLVRKLEEQRGEPWLKGQAAKDGADDSRPDEASGSPPPVAPAKPPVDPGEWESWERDRALQAYRVSADGFEETLVLIEELIVDPQLQLRELDEATVRHYATLLDQSSPPPVDVAVLGDRKYLANGWHRREAATRKGRRYLTARLHPVNSWGEILLLAVRANAYNGLPLSLKARKRAARRLLLLYPQRSNRWIGQDVGLSHNTVRRLREDLEAGGQIDHLTTFIGWDGKQYPRETEPSWSGPEEETEPEEEGRPERHVEPEASTAPSEPEASSPEEVPPAPAPPAAPEPEELSQDLEPEAPPEERPAFTGHLRPVVELHTAPEAAEDEWAEGEPEALPAQAPGIDVSRVPVEIYRGDARDLVWTLPEPVHLTVTSPPYNVGIEYDGYSDNLPTGEYLDLLSGVFRAVRAKTVDGGRIAVVVPFGVQRSPWVPFMPMVLNQLIATGWTPRGLIVWDKGSTGNRTSWGSFRSPTDPALRDRTECILIAHAGGSRLDVPTAALERDEKGVYSPFLQDGELFMALAEDYWRCSPELPSRVQHPAPFPIALVDRLIRLYAFPGARILDPFAGTGTTGVAARRLGCPAYLIDQSERYCELARQRIKAEVGSA